MEGVAAPIVSWSKSAGGAPAHLPLLATDARIENSRKTATFARRAEAFGENRR
jgi:hypothetical protein